MKLSEFKFDLPTELIAKHPIDDKDKAKLMVINRKEKTIEHKTVRDLLDYFKEGDTLVVNDSKVFPARMYGYKEKTGAKIEVFLLREINGDAHLWDALVDPARKIRVGNKLYFGESDLVAEVIDNTTSRGRTIRFLYDGTADDFRNVIDKLGETPLPRIIEREVEEADRNSYQTIFAKNVGAVTVPAAGLHFNSLMVKRLQLKSVGIASITMHVSQSSFNEVEVEDLTKHKTFSEQFFVPDETAVMVNKTMEAEQRVCAVGISVLRSLESSVSANNRLKGNAGWTDKFLYQPGEPKIANALLTNFHLSCSVPLITTCAFGGHDLVLEGYKQAIEQNYRFFQYGDAMLIL